MKFPLGQVVATPGALAALSEADQTAEFIRRHVVGDWGEVMNTIARERTVTSEGFRLLSAYSLKDGTRIWVITEADRSSTNILLPEEY